MISVLLEILCELSNYMHPKPQAPWVLYQMDEVKKISDCKFQYPLSNSSPCKKSRLKINIYEAEQKAIYYVCLWYNMQNSG